MNYVKRWFRLLRNLRVIRKNNEEAIYQNSETNSKVNCTIRDLEIKDPHYEVKAFANEILNNQKN